MDTMTATDITNLQIKLEDAEDKVRASREEIMTLKSSNTELVAFCAELRQENLDLISTIQKVIDQSSDETIA